MAAFPCRSQGGGDDARRSGSLGNLPDMIWQDSLMAPEDVVIQQHPDGSLRQLGNGSFGKVSCLAASHPSLHCTQIVHIYQILHLFPTPPTDKGVALLLH